MQHSYLPCAGKPRYVMGIGYPLDVVVCSALGADMYDSVYPTRTARFGVALVPEVSLCSPCCPSQRTTHQMLWRCFTF